MNSPVVQLVKNMPAKQETWVQSLSGEDPLEEEMTTRSSILAWEIPRTKESGRLQSMGLQESDTAWRLYPQGQRDSKSQTSLSLSLSLSLKQGP